MLSSTLVRSRQSEGTRFPEAHQLWGLEEVETTMKEINPLSEPSLNGGKKVGKNFFLLLFLQLGVNVSSLPRPTLKDFWGFGWLCGSRRIFLTFSLPWKKKLRRCYWSHHEIWGDSVPKLALSPEQRQSRGNMRAYGTVTHTPFIKILARDESR